MIASGGSSGAYGPAATWAPVLASRGFATLAIAYFAMPGLPDSLIEVPVEIVRDAIAWATGREGTSRGPAGIIGQSRGSELALLSASSLDEIGAAVAIAPSGVSWGGFGPRGPIDQSAWSVGGTPFPFAGAGMRAPAPTGGPIALTPLFLEAMADEADIRQAEIPVERARGPILAISGTEDAMWPSTPLTEVAERRAKEHAFTHAFDHLRYPDSGHMVAGLPGIPTEIESVHRVQGGHYAFGGTREGTAASRIDSWTRIVAFLDTSLRPQ